MITVMITVCAICGAIIRADGDSVELGLCASCRKEQEKKERERSEQKPGKK